MIGSQKGTKILALALISMMAMCAGFIVLNDSESDAKTFEGIDGDLTAAATIDIAPGFSWTYTLKFPADLNAGLEVTAPVDGLVAAGATAKITKAVDGTIWGTYKVTLPSTIAPGTYDVVLKADHSASGQTVYQYIIFNVKSGIAITPESTILDQQSVGTEASFTFNVAGGLGTTYTTTATAVPDGFTATSNNTGSAITITGTPTADMVGVEQSITISTVGDKGDKATKTYTFSVVNNLVISASAETLGSLDGSATTSIITVPDGLDVTWTVNKVHAGITFDEATKTLKVESNEYISETVTIIAHSTNPVQDSNTVSIVVKNEMAGAAVVLDQSVVKTWNTNTAKTVTPTVDGTHSGIMTWSLGETIDGVSIDPTNGIVTIASDAAPVATQTVTVKAETNFGKQIQQTFFLTIEEKLVFDVAEADKTLTIVTDSTPTAVTAGDVAATAQYGNPVLTIQQDAGVTEAKIVDGKLNVTANSPGQTYTVTVTATTDAGQTATQTLTVHTYSPLTFEGAPATGVIAWAL